MIGFCTDSNAQLPPELVDRYRVEVVPLTIVMDGEEFLEGVDLDADAFYARFAGGLAPEVTTAAPGPGRFAAAYEALASSGADEIVSVHIGSAMSGTLNSANVAAQDAPVPVHLVDTGTASFAIACCLLEAAEAVAKGASAGEAAEVAGEVARRTGNVFVVGALDLARRGGRLAPDAEALAHEAIPVLALVDGAIRAVGSACTVDEAADLMAAQVRAAGPGLRVGLSIADAGSEPIWRALEVRLQGADEVLDLVRYRVGPSVGVHTGPGTAGAVWYRAV